MKFLAFILVSIMLLYSTSSPSSADFNVLNIPKEILVQNPAPTKIEKVIVAPVKRVQMFNYSNTQYSSELAYYFYKYGFTSSPVSHIIFENEVVTLNPNWYTDYFENSLNKKVILILLVYDESFDPVSYTKMLEEWRNATLAPAIKFTSIDSIDDFEYKKFFVETGEKSKVIFEPINKDLGFRPLFTSLDMKTKELLQIKLDDINIPDMMKPGEVAKAKAEIKNLSNYDLVLGDTNILNLKFRKDSSFFVNDKWLNQKTISIIKEGIIKKGTSLQLEFEINGPLIPGKSEEELYISLGDKELSSKKMSVEVENIGQKLLRISTYSLDSLSVKVEPNYSSKEISKTGRGQVHIYTEVQNGFYKIKIGNKEGWIQRGYIEVLNIK